MGDFRRAVPKTTLSVLEKYIIYSLQNAVSVSPKDGIPPACSCLRYSVPFGSLNDVYKHIQARNMDRLR